MSTRILFTTKFVAVLAGLLVTVACGQGDQGATAQKDQASTGVSDVSSITALQSTDVVAGTGAEATGGKTVSVHYTGWLYNPTAPDHHGNKFDSSRDRNEPFSFLLGGGQVIQGWDQGVAGMKVGGKRTLVIPPAMGYGARGAGGVIPPNAVLVFDVELLGVR
jgi:FKBP-type peptidyl-prolyl cis-trans isomerase